MPPHPDRVRRNYPKCFGTGHHWMIMNNSDIAPYTGPTGLRTTWRVCIECGNKQSYTRTQREFLDEIESRHYNQKLW